MTWKKSSGCPKQDLKEGFNDSCVPAFSCPIFCVICVAILWEAFYIYILRSLENKPYIYPEYVFDFQATMNKREKLLQQYQHYHKTAEVERRSNLSLQEFWDLYDAKWPVIITDVVDTWPASKWTSEFLNTTYGNERVVIKLARMHGSYTEIRGVSGPLNFFVEHVNNIPPGVQMYVVDELFIVTRPELREQILPSKYTKEDFFQLFPKGIQPWDSLFLWGAPNSSSGLHMDPYNWTGTSSVIKGRKKWKLFLPGQDHLLYPSQGLCGFPLECLKYDSMVDAFAPDLQQYPLFRLAKYIEVEHKAGEMLIIPTGWFHQAINPEETIAISGQIMNRNNYRYVLEEILKAENLDRRRLPDDFHNLQPQEQVKIFLSLLPKKLLKKGKERTKKYLNSIRKVSD